MSRLARASTMLAALALVSAVAVLSGSPASSDDPLAAAAPPPPADTSVARSRGCARYAAPRGSNGAPGTRSRPFRTTGKLVRALDAGQTGCLMTGRYGDGGRDYVLRLRRPGVTIRSAPGQRARVAGIVMVQPGADNARLAHLDIVGTGEQNTVKVYAANVTVENNDITNRLRGDSCMILGSSSGGRATRPVVTGNVFHDCGSPANGNQDHGIYAAQVDDARIVGNVFSNASGLSIQLYPDAQDSRVLRNVLDGGPDTVRGGVVIGGDGNHASTGNVVARNVIAYAATFGVYSYWDGPVGRDNRVRRNCLWATAEGAVGDQGGLEVDGNVTADPGFRDRAARDYRLAADSPCRPVVGGRVGHPSSRTG